MSKFKAYWKRTPFLCVYLDFYTLVMAGMAFCFTTNSVGALAYYNLVGDVSNSFGTMVLIGFLQVFLGIKMGLAQWYRRYLQQKYLKSLEPPQVKEPFHNLPDGNDPNTSPAAITRQEMCGILQMMAEADAANMSAEQKEFYRKRQEIEDKEQARLDEIARLKKEKWDKFWDAVIIAVMIGAALAGFYVAFYQLHRLYHFYAF